MRAGLGLMMLVALAVVRADLRWAIRTRQLRLHLFRNTMHVSSSYLWAMSLLLSRSRRHSRSSSPRRPGRCCWRCRCWANASRRSRIGAVVFGLLGVLVILRPGLATFQPAALLC